MDVSGLLKLTGLGVNMQHKICDACETVAHCTNHGCIPLTQLRAAEAHHSDKGYQLGNQADYEAFVAKRNQSQNEVVNELLKEVAKLRREITELRRQNSDYGWQTNPDRMGGSYSQDEIDNVNLWK